MSDDTTVADSTVATLEELVRRKGWAVSPSGMGAFWWLDLCPGSTDLSDLMLSDRPDYGAALAEMVEEALERTLPAPARGGAGS